MTDCNIMCGKPLTEKFRVTMEPLRKKMQSIISFSCGKVKDCLVEKNRVFNMQEHSLYAGCYCMCMDESWNLFIEIIGGNPAENLTSRRRDHVSMSADQETYHVLTQEKWRTYIKSHSESFLKECMIFCFEKCRKCGVRVFILLRYTIRIYGFRNERNPSLKRFSQTYSTEKRNAPMSLFINS